tara:strand:+ start:10540 stop:11424 length:885 start_codon:yes stop_codon:yes gene_type:complete
MDNKFPGKDVSKSDLIEKFPLAHSAQNRDGKVGFMVGDFQFDKSNLAVMAGPNMVESEELIVETAISVKESGAQFLRGGAFKPLSFPYRSKKYTETRLDGLNWLKTAKEESGLLVITEVMEERFLDAVCESADILQIGSRNMQNYPLITEAAKTQKPLMIKRGYGSSIRDWLGAAEYALIEKNFKVMLCERGVVVPHTHRETSRFLLDIQAIPAAQEITDLPIISDPSHATFWEPWVEPMAKASVSAGCDGIMIEVHPDPKNAAVDPLQPLSFKQFKDMMTKIKILAEFEGRSI